MYTPSGRFEVNKSICLTMTDFHQESWNPVWGLQTILVGFLSFMVRAGSGDCSTVKRWCCGCECLVLEYLSWV